MTKTQIDRQHQMTALLRRELEVADAMRRLNEYRDEAGWKQDRTPSQKEMLSSIPPITAFMGMEG
ncbi:hypothetical protein [Shinella zoogloeoides]|uniref:hypothetical protein n=1 Tax=Shinella zoogloeoides TaxID=352475 RepID=UPI00299EFE22|nr:hypothetical protein [Shinella zoogloeoides]WPE22446.1 hypothetical protein ShzoTeo12_36620 [Shinella zoogloeoides]